MYLLNVLLVVRRGQDLSVLLQWLGLLQVDQAAIRTTLLHFFDQKGYVQPGFADCNCRCLLAPRGHILIVLAGVISTLLLVRSILMLVLVLILVGNILQRNALELSLFGLDVY